MEIATGLNAHKKQITEPTIKRFAHCGRSRKMSEQKAQPSPCAGSEALVDLLGAIRTRYQTTGMTLPEAYQAMCHRIDEFKAAATAATAERTPPDYDAEQIMDDAFAERLADDERVVAHLKAVTACDCPVHKYLRQPPAERTPQQQSSEPSGNAQSPVHSVSADQKTATQCEPTGRRGSEANLLTANHQSPAERTPPPSAIEALKAWEHWYSVDSTEFNRDTAREMGLKVLNGK
jgi:hypothetical protein